MICLCLSRVHNATSKIVTREELQGPVFNFITISGKGGVGCPPIRACSVITSYTVYYISAKLVGVGFHPLGDLTWNDPVAYTDALGMDILQ